MSSGLKCEEQPANRDGEGYCRKPSECQNEGGGDQM